jgi:hypothetical protein
MKFERLTFARGKLAEKGHRHHNECRFQLIRFSETAQNGSLWKLRSVLQISFLRRKTSFAAPQVPLAVKNEI